MALIHSFEKSGNTLFRYRGQIPVILFLLAVPVIYYTGDSWLSHPARLAITIFSVFISFLGFLVRSIAIATTPKGTSGRNRDEQVAESLNTTGIYSVVRHPLYLGNYLMWIGIVIYTYNFWFVLVVSLLYWLYYERIMFAEERFLERKFGDSYMDWANATPSFVPAFRGYRKNIVPFSTKSILRREYSGVLATVIGFTFIDDLRRYFNGETFEWETVWHVALVVTIVLAIILRSLKHYTSLLKESDRS